jgi:oligopeptide transport system ATP-binding protein
MTAHAKAERDEQAGTDIEPALAEVGRESLLQVSGLSKRYPSHRNLLGRTTAWTPAVDDVAFTLDAGETLALVGESGAGKSTTGRIVLRLVTPDSGQVRFEGTDVSTLDRTQLRAFRQRAQMIFQDPFGSLDPRISVGDSVAEPLLVHFRTARRERLHRAEDLLARVGLPRRVLDRYPAELSGGQLQRVAIARALTLRPKLLVCDEPVAALDVSVRAQVLNLMKDLQAELGMAYLFITHDLALVEVIADRVAVMRAGRVSEQGTVEQIFAQPADPYTRQLLSAIPIPVPRKLRSNRSVTGQANAPPAVQDPATKVEPGR